MKGIQSAERVSQKDASDNFVFQRSQLAYHMASKLVKGDVLEIGTGSGYGVSIISPQTKTFVTVDKFNCGIDLSEYPNVEFRQMKVPPLEGLASNSFDFVITFQVIEHINDDFAFLEEIHRVLRPGGKLIVSTPNKKMSLTRNPWHVREYTVDGFKNLLESFFRKVEAKGVYGQQNVMEYYQRNKESVERITKYDLLNAQQWMPRRLLQLPYNILNRLNRRKLLIRNRELTSHITMSDYFFESARDNCFDLFYIAEK